MPKAIRVHATGGPEVMQYEQVDVGAPAAGEVRVRHGAIGLNFIDVYFRTGLYKAPALPFTPGFEAAGVVEAVGEGVEGLAAGDHVGYCTAPLGSYAQVRIVPARALVKIPAGIDDQTAAALLLKGLTAWYLLRRTYRVQAGETILVHAAAGGVGLITCQWARHLGATVIGTVSSDAKAELARAHGCDHPIVYTREDFVTRVRELTGGAGLPVVYDSVGKDTFLRSLECLRPRGMMVSFGQSSGAVPPLDIGVLSQKGALYLTRPTLFVYAGERAELEAGATELFDLVRAGTVRIEIGQRYALADAAAAHRALESRATTGSTVLLP
ncbi:MAG: quinone oxidoreductase [Gammaproteobacteria bacterium]|nr:quinone oxidoreductase [Gammaproteobacteria bacterium]